MTNFDRNAWTNYLKEKAGTGKLPKKSKHQNIKTVTDGIKFDSKKESGRYLQLKLMQGQGMISELQLQVKYKLQIRHVQVNDTIVDLGYCIMNSYIADFTYKDKNGIFVVEDVKSDHTRKLKTYKLKKKLMKIIYNIEIKES